MGCRWQSKARLWELKLKWMLREFIFNYLCSLEDFTNYQKTSTILINLQYLKIFCTQLSWEKHKIKKLINTSFSTNTLLLRRICLRIQFIGYILYHTMDCFRKLPRNYVFIVLSLTCRKKKIFDVKRGKKLMVFEMFAITNF